MEVGVPVYVGVGRAGVTVYVGVFVLVGNGVEVGVIGWPFMKAYTSKKAMLARQMHNHSAATMYTKVLSPFFISNPMCSKTDPMGMFTPLLFLEAGQGDKNSTGEDERALPGVQVRP